MAEEKKIVIVIRHPPHGTFYSVEGLRMTVALNGDMEPITVIFSFFIFLI